MTHLGLRMYSTIDLDLSRGDRRYRRRIRGQVPSEAILRIGGGESQRVATDDCHQVSSRDGSRLEEPCGYSLAATEKKGPQTTDSDTVTW